MLNTMINTKQAFRAGAGIFAALGLAASLMAGGPSGSPTSVIVTNPVTVANPVTTVAVSGGQIAVANGPTAPVHTTDNSAFTAASYAFGCTLPGGQASTVCTGNFFPPAGKRLVIEDVSFGGILPTGQKAIVEIDTHFNGSLVTAMFTPDALDNGAQVLVSGGRATKFYADSFGAVQVLVTRTGSLNSGSVNIYLWGRLVDMQ